MNDDNTGPVSHTYISQRLKLHYVDWGNEGAPPVLLVHGGRDHARSWDWVAQGLRDDYRVIAVDLRGHGDSQWNTCGTYNTDDFVCDLDKLVDVADLAPVRIIAHSRIGRVEVSPTRNSVISVSSNDMTKAKSAAVTAALRMWGKTT